MHNTALIRGICAEINRETDRDKIDHLLRLLRAVIQNDLDEIRIRLEFIRQKYAIAFEQSPSLEAVEMPTPEPQE